MRAIDADALLAEYDRVHVGPPGGARKLIEDAPEVPPKVVAEIKIDNDALQRMVDEAVENIKAELAEQDWIPCKKPPTKNGAYLVTVHPDYIVPGGGQVDILVWVDDGWFYMVYDTKTARYQITRFPDPVIAWRSLPAPYKEDRNGSD